MAKRKVTLVCPFNSHGCESDTDEGIERCCFWGELKGCDLENAVKAIKGFTNQLKRIEERIEEGGLLKREEGKR